MQTFKAHPLLNSGQLQTYAGTLLTGNTRAETHNITLVELEDGDRLQLFVHKPRQDMRANSPAVLLLHGLGGSADSAYMLRITRKLNQHGMLAIRFNHRGCGPGGAAMARAIYHAGRGDDLAAAIACCLQNFPERPLLIVGFSLSGNMLLRYLGAHVEAAARLKNHLRAALAVCPPVDLEACSLSLSRMRNWPIDRHYTRLMRKAAATRRQLFPELDHPHLPQKLNLRLFDQIYTAPLAGYANRDDYYCRASAKSYLPSIGVPTTIIAADDDPIIPLTTWQNASLSPWVELVLTRGGGHMGYIAAELTDYHDRRWMDAAVVAWAKQYA